MCLLAWGRGNMRSTNSEQPSDQFQIHIIKSRDPSYIFVQKLFHSDICHNREEKIATRLLFHEPFPLQGRHWWKFPALRFHCYTVGGAIRVQNLRIKTNAKRSKTSDNSIAYACCSLWKKVTFFFVWLFVCLKAEAQDLNLFHFSSVKHNILYELSLTGKEPHHDSSNYSTSYRSGTTWRFVNEEFRCKSL